MILTDVGSFTSELCSVFEILSLDVATVVFHEGDIGELFYIILAGAVDVQALKRNAAGKLQNTTLVTLTGNECGVKVALSFIFIFFCRGGRGNSFW